MSDSPAFPVGKLLCGGFEGTTVTAQARRLIVTHKVLAMLLLRKNVVDARQTAQLIRDLQYIAYSQAGYAHPLMFAVDEEGGMMNLVFDLVALTQFPGAMALAASGDVDLVYQVLRAMAQELREVGFLIILGPVLDVVTKLLHQLVGVRSFGTTVEEVTKYGAACARGLQEAGLVTIGKHFPGIGNASVDLLLELPMMADLLEQIRALNSVPFKELFKQGLLDGVLAAGCGVPTISPDETHACLLPVVINQFLRQELGFDGIVVLECLEMDALYHLIGLGQGVILALHAGCDLVMVCHDMALQDEAVDLMHKAVANGNLDDELLVTCLRRLDRLHQKLPLWKDIFPTGNNDGDIVLFRDRFPDDWMRHQQLLELAYQKSITLVRDYGGTLPISRFFEPKSVPDEGANVLLLTPLLYPIYPSQHSSTPELYTGEEVFQRFGDLLLRHPEAKARSFSVLHTTYTANGLTALHELLIEALKAVIVLTLEASRNMYQIGIVKYISILCGAHPSSFSSATAAQLTKPLVIVATLLPYDFFYHRGIGSAYLCCYDYTYNVLQQLVGVLMGDIQAEGCIPGEKKFITAKQGRKRKSSVDEKPRLPRKIAPKRRWLVDEFDLQRDWLGLVQLWRNNAHEEPENETSGFLENSSEMANFHDENFYRKLLVLLQTTSGSQKHFVIRNSLLNILYGAILTWVDEHQQVSLGTDLTAENSPKKGSILYVLVDKAKRHQSVGKNLHARAIRYLVREQGCTEVQLGCSFPSVVLPQNSNLVKTGSKVTAFMNSVGWDVGKDSFSRKKHVMLLRDLSGWSVPKKIFRELMIVGVRFDICTHPEKLMRLIETSTSKLLVREDAQDGEGLSAEDDLFDKQSTKSLYLEAVKYLGNNGGSFGVKIIIALEPTNQNVIGSIVLFTNKSQLSKFYPFMDEAMESPEKGPVGGIVGPVIDPSYSNLTEIFKFGLICSGITFLKSAFADAETPMDRCIIAGVNDDKAINGVKEIGFQEWKIYHDFYDRKLELAFRE